jgi:hypothetical protein
MQVYKKLLYQKYNFREVSPALRTEFDNNTPLLRLERDIDLGKRKRAGGEWEMDGIIPGEPERDEQRDVKHHAPESRASQWLPVHPSLLAHLTSTSVKATIAQTTAQTTAPTITKSAETEQATAQSSALEEDIGVFDDPGPVPAFTVPAFTVPKPSLKAPARKSGKGKGVVSSVLGADGSVRLEQSRML